MRTDPACLELTPEEMQAMGREVLDRLVAHLASIGEQPARGDVSDAAARSRALVEPPPEHGRELGAILTPLFDEWIGASFNAASPGYLAFIPGGGLYPAALAGLIAEGVNRFTGLWNAAPLLVQLEANALDWLRGWMGLPGEARGLLTSGGSMASFGAVITARERHLGSDIRRGVVYATAEAHHCIAKAARLAGIFPDRLRRVPIDEHQRMRVDALADAIAADRASGLQPFLVVSTAGTTNTGAVDPLDAIAALCRDEGLWHHVDAAYGGFFRLLPELAPLLDGIASADSVVLDPHKGLFLPYGVGALLVRDGELLRAAHGGTAGYLPDIPPEAYSPNLYGPELSRDFRGLRLWLPLQLFGVERFRAALREKRQLALWAHARLAEHPSLVVSAPPELSLFTFHVRRESVAEADEATRALIEAVNARGRVMISGARVGGRHLARVCVLSFRTRRAHVEQAVEDILAAAG